MRYRAEIDGLRAVAVAPVMLFHAGFDAFSGGFVGVDVFLVISGYLITSIILSEKDAGTFSLVNFYERRARRILPALFFVMAACVPFAWIWLLPDDMKDFSRSVSAVSLLASNVLFYRESGYFDVAAELKPLLHTWSLAVEEQFYLIYPLALVLTWSLGKHRIAWLLTIAMLTSLAVAQWAAYHKPAAAFYLLPMRGWELAIGGLIAFAPLHDVVTKLGGAARQALSALGLLLIFYGVFAFSERTPFASVYALVPTIGTALVILCATPATAVGKVLGNKALVAIGVISYGAYLWHQPLLAFARHRAPSEPDALLMLALLGSSIVLAYFSWRFVETPFRRSNRFTRRQVFVAAGCASAAFVGFGLMGANGYENRYSAAERQFLASVQREAVVQQMTASFDRFRCFADQSQSPDVLFENDCVSGNAARRRIVLFGDSHAAHLLHGVRKVFGEQGYLVEQYSSASCRSIDFAQYPQRCRTFYDAFIRRALPRIREGDILLISSNWSNTLRGLSVDQFQASLRSLFKELDHSSAIVLLVGASPRFHEAPQRFAFRKRLLDTGNIRMKVEDNDEVNAILRKEASASSSLFVDPMRAFCAGEGELTCQARGEGQFLFLDAAHLSEPGSERLARMIWNEVDAAFPQGAGRSR